MYVTEIKENNSKGILTTLTHGNSWAYVLPRVVGEKSIRGAPSV